MIDTKVKLRPFTVPNYVIQETPARPRECGFKEASKYALHELDDATIEDLLEQFRRDVREKVRKGREASSASGS